MPLIQTLTARVPASSRAAACCRKNPGEHHGARPGNRRTAEFFVVSKSRGGCCLDHAIADVGCSSACQHHRRPAGRRRSDQPHHCAGLPLSTGRHNGGDSCQCLAGIMPIDWPSSIGKNCPEIEHDVMRVVFFADCGDAPRTADS